MTDDESMLDQAIGELYAADLDQFTPRRNALAKHARAAGDKESATAITALRKPTQSAFTINRLARTDPSAIAGLIEVGSELRRAQRSADGKQLRELNSQRRTLVDGLTRRAFEIIGQQSPSAGQREEVNATLTAALADPTIAEQVRQGILVRAADSAAFGFGPPELTLIRSPARPATPALSDKESVVTRDRAGAEGDGRRAAQAKALAKAQHESDDADIAVQAAVASIDASRQLIRMLQHQLTGARRQLDENQQQKKLAHARQRKAREALHKAKG